VSGQTYEETIASKRVGTLVERFTPEFEVFSVSLALSEDGESEVLSLQRGFVPEGEDGEGICLVLSPSQQCIYKPFQELTLARTSLGMRFTAEAQRVFNASSVLVTFDVSDDIFQEVKEKLEVMCAGETYFRCGKNAV